METRLLYNSKTSLTPKSIEIKTKGEFYYAVIKAEEEHKIWGEILFPGDDKDYEIQLHPVEISWEIRNQDLEKKINEINVKANPYILFTYEGIKPSILKDVQLIEKASLKHLEKNIIMFPNNPVQARDQKIAEEERQIMDLDPESWLGGW